MNHRNYFFATAIVFSVVGLLHLLRIVFGWDAVIGGWTVPMWLSGVAMVVTAVLAYYGFAHGSRAR